MSAFFTKAARRRYLRMEQAAVRAELLDPPPFSSQHARDAWASGYRDALRDIARDRLQEPTGGEG